MCKQWNVLSTRQAHTWLYNEFFWMEAEYFPACKKPIKECIQRCNKWGESECVKLDTRKSAHRKEMMSGVYSILCQSFANVSPLSRYSAHENQWIDSPALSVCYVVGCLIWAVKRDKKVISGQGEERSLLIRQEWHHMKQWRDQFNLSSLFFIASFGSASSMPSSLNSVKTW